MTSKQRVEQLFKRLDKLNIAGIKIYLDMITNKADLDLYFRIQAVDRLNHVIEEDIFRDIPRTYLDRYSKKYNITANVRSYDVIDGKLVLNVVDV